jgi:hypothetical protein
MAPIVSAVKVGNEDDDDNLDEINYKNFEAYIKAIHPRHEGKKFGICDSVGYLNCCGKAKITELAKEIGIGPALFLMSTKSLAIFFFIITIINAPVFMFYWLSGTDSFTYDINDMFAKLSLGNVG